jgi:hypothetical protein
VPPAGILLDAFERDMCLKPLAVLNWLNGKAPGSTEGTPAVRRANEHDVWQENEVKG